MMMSLLFPEQCDCWCRPLSDSVVLRLLVAGTGNVPWKRSQQMVFVLLNEHGWIRVRLYWCERDIASRWVHRESNLMFILSSNMSNKDQKSLDETLPSFTKDVGQLVVEQDTLPHAVHYRVDGEEDSDQPRAQILWECKKHKYSSNGKNRKSEVSTIVEILMKFSTNFVDYFASTLFQVTPITRLLRSIYTCDMEQERLIFYRID